MNLSKYGRIGKAPFIKAIGIQENYKKIVYTESKELDRNESGCFSCENYKQIEFLEYLPKECQEKACQNCKNCPRAVYKTVTKESYQYVNEKNMYGYKPRLKPIAMKLLLIYHFAEPDDKGLVRCLSPKELASMLHCSVRSIKNANNTLQEYGYILYSQDPMSKKRFQVFLTEYETYHLPADQGGRGYATFNIDSLMEFINMKDINQLRILLRAALDLDTNKDEDKPIILSNDYDSLRRFLPSYCKPGIIRKALSSSTSMFQVKFKDEFVHLQMNADYHGRRAYEKGCLAYATEMEEYFNGINKKISKINERLIKKEPVNKKDLEYIQKEGFDHQLDMLSTPLYNSFYLHLDSENYKDLGILCESFSVERVKEALRYINKHIPNPYEWKNFGALVRTILRNKLNLEEIVSLFNPA